MPTCFSAITRHTLHLTHRGTEGTSAVLTASQSLAQACVACEQVMTR